MKDEIAQFKRFLKRRFGNRSTPKHYINDLSLFVNHVGDLPVARISAHHIDSFVEDQVHRGLKPTTINRRLASLHSFFEFVAAFEADDAPPNPVIWRRHKIKQGRPLPNDVPDAQIDLLFAAIGDVRDKAIFGLMIGAGLRVGEVASLEMDDLLPPLTPAKMAPLRVCGKGEKERMVWLTPLWYGIVTNWLAVRPAADNDFLFLNRLGHPLTVRGIQHRLQTHCRKAGLQIAPHQLRHTFSRRLAEQRMPIESISKLLGHAQIETTQRYTAGADPDLHDEFRDAMSALSQAATPSTSSLPLVPMPPAQQEAADPAQLEQILHRFDHFPDWLHSLLSSYLRYRWRNWQPHMAAQHAGRLTRRQHAIWVWLLQQRPLDDCSSLRRSDVEAWLTARAEAGLTTNTLCNDLTALRGFLYFVQEQDILLSPNIFRIPYPQRPNPLPRTLSPEEFHRLVQLVFQQTAADTPQNRLDRTWFLTLAHTGIRLCELLNLRLSDIDLASGCIRIRHSKNGYGRIVYATADLSHALLIYLPLRPNVSDDHLFLERDKQLLDGLVRTRLRRWGQLLNLDVSPHRLRHTHATLLINQGIPIESLRKLLGHRSLGVTQIYARLSDQVVQQQFEKAIEGIDGIAAPNWPLHSSIINVQAAREAT
jgi:site-specific recombinase XerD